MRTAIRKMGNSHGVIIPKPILAQTGLGDEAEMSVENNAIVLRKPRNKVRVGWAQASEAIAKAGDDKLVWPAFANEGDKDLVW